MSEHASGGQGAAVVERPVPPVEFLSIATLTLIVIGGVFVAAHLPSPVALGFPVTCVSLAGALLLANMFLLSRAKDFAWKSFFMVTKWALLGEGIVMGMLEYVFVYDHTRGPILALVSTVLVIFTVDVAMLFGFSVARFQES